MGAAYDNRGRPIQITPWKGSWAATQWAGRLADSKNQPLRAGECPHCGGPHTLSQCPTWRADRRPR